jgi:hypothetical protein
MGLTKYPQGLSSFGVPVLGSAGEIITGNVFFVDSNNAVANDNNVGKNSKRPLATIDGAINKCTANKGDVIIVMPNHAESVTAAAGIACDVAGITIIGLGSGEQRPTITFTTSTGADVDIDAADVTIKNILFKAGVDALTGPIDVNSTDFTLENCEMRDTTGFQTTQWIVATSQSDRMKIVGNKHVCPAAGPASWIKITGGAEDVIIANNDDDSLYSTGNISNTSTALVRAKISGNRLVNRGTTATACIDLVSTATGTISDNYLRNTSDAGGKVTNIIDASDMELFENYAVTADNETGALIGTAST